MHNKTTWQFILSGVTEKDMLGTTLSDVLSRTQRVQKSRFK